jgi:hypothetical protein
MTMAFAGAGLVLLQVPKTGTTSLEDAWSPRADLTISADLAARHMYADEFELAHAAIMAPGFSYVAVVREPVDWLVSWWRWRTDDPVFPSNDLSFADWFAGLFDLDGRLQLVRDLGRYEISTRPTVWWRYENIDAMTEWLASAIGVDAPQLQVLNASNDRNPMLTDDLRARIEAAFPFNAATYETAR